MFEFERVVKDSGKIFESTLYRLLHAVHAEGNYNGKVQRQFKRTEKQIVKLLKMMERR